MGARSPAEDAVPDKAEWEELRARGAPARRASRYLLRPLEILRGYRRRDLPADLGAGLTVAAVAIPQAIAYASIAELPAETGLYTAVVAAIVGSLWGSSRHLATGPVNATSLLVLPVLMAAAAPGSPQFLMAASLVAVLAGLFRIAAAFLRVGALVTLVSRPVLVGFTAGAAVHIAVGQTRHLLGLKVPATPELYRTVAALVGAIEQTHWLTAGVGLATLVVLLALRRLGPRTPASLAVIVAAAAGVGLLGLDTAGVAVVGHIPRSLPPLRWPADGWLPDLEVLRAVATGSLAVAALGLVEAVAAAQNLARKTGDRLDSNQEFFGQGLANVASGLFSGYPCSGSFTRSALCLQTGGRTQIAGVVTGLAILGGVLLLGPFAASIPKAAISAVLYVVAWSMVDRAGIRLLLRSSRSEALVMGATFCATLLLPLDAAVLSGIALALAVFVIRSSLPRVYAVVPDAEFSHFVEATDRPVCPQLGVMTIHGPLFFGAVYHVEEELRHNHERHPGQQYLVLRMHGVNICDMSGVGMLEATVRSYRELGGDIYLIRPRKPVMDLLESSGFLSDTLGRGNVLERETGLVHLVEDVLDPSVCVYECEQRVFAECRCLDQHRYAADLPPSGHSHGHSLLVGPETFFDLARLPDARVLDVREPAEHRRGHIAGSEVIPLRLLAERAAGLPKDIPLLVCCRSDRRSSRGLHTLEGLGFSKLYGLKGGLLAWRAAGLPLVTDDPDRPPP